MIPSTLRLLTLSLAGVLASAAPSRAGEVVLRLDPAATRVAFHLGATMHSAEGTIALARGEIRCDLAAGTASGEVVLAAASATTGHQGRDEKMHREVLESATFPEIVFRPSAITANVDDRGTGVVTLAGTVAIHGAGHEVRVTAAVSRDGDAMRATGTLSVPYVAWGLHDPSVFVLRVAKVVEVSFTAVGTLAPPPAPAAAEAGR